MDNTQITADRVTRADRTVADDILGNIKLRRGVSYGVLLALVLSGYPLAGYMTDVFALHGNALSIAFRVMVVVLSMYVMTVYFDGRKLLGVWGALLLFWWLLYAIRLYVDLLIGHPFGAGRALLFYAVVVVVPSFALIFSERYRLERVAGPAVFWISALVVCAALIFQYSGLLGARSLMTQTGRLSSYSVNSITLGHVASSAIIAAFALPQFRGMIWFFTKVFVVLAGLVCVVLAASKGALLALVMSLVFLAAAKARLGKLVAFLLVLSAVILAVIVADWDYQALPLWERVTEIGSDASTIERLRLYEDAYRQFLDSPVLGSAYVERNSGTYPHNLVLESFMSMGILGGLLFISLNIACIYRSWKLAVQGRVLLPMLYVQAFIDSLFSGALYAHAPLWAMLSIILSPSLGKRRADSVGERIGSMREGV